MLKSEKDADSKLRLTFLRQSSRITYSFNASNSLAGQAGQGSGAAADEHRLYRHDNEFSGVYDHTTSSNPPLPFRPCAFLCMRGMLRYATL